MKGQNADLGPGGYDSRSFEILFAVEDRHFWFRTKKQVISLLAGQVAALLSPGYRVLEMGCGDGNVLRFLERACPTGTVVGMDLFGEGIRHARSRTSVLWFRAMFANRPSARLSRSSASSMS